MERGERGGCSGELRACRSGASSVSRGSKVCDCSERSRGLRVPSAVLSNGQ